MFKIGQLVKLPNQGNDWAVIRSGPHTNDSIGQDFYLVHNLFKHKFDYEYRIELVNDLDITNGYIFFDSLMAELGRLYYFVKLMEKINYHTDDKDDIGQLLTLIKKLGRNFITTYDIPVMDAFDKYLEELPQ